MNILILDFEATGIDTNTARVTEIGAMVVNEAWQSAGPMMSQLVWDSSYPAITPEVEEVTGISQAMLLSSGMHPTDAFRHLAEVASGVSMCLAYNREYDEKLFRAELARVGQPSHPLAHVPWICGMEDVESNYKKKCWKLSHLALDYGVAVDPSKLHRAINDVELTRQMLMASGASPTAMYQYQLSPWIFVRAKVKKPWDDGGKSTGEAKALGYRWERAAGTDRVFEKTWVKRIKQQDWEREVTVTPFQIEVV